MKKISLILLGFILGMSTTGFAAYSIFSDVDADAYYADAVNNVAYKGIITGYDNYNFGPEDPLTRGQMAVIVERLDEHILNTLKEQYNLQYSCPSSGTLSCTGDEAIGSGCKNQNYINWVNVNCSQ